MGTGVKAASFLSAVRPEHTHAWPFYHNTVGKINLSFSKEKEVTPSRGKPEHMTVVMDLSSALFPRSLPIHLNSYPDLNLPDFQKS